ncbi:NADP-dependent oxidoreductase [Hydrogenophaga sp. BPS33]|uniref:NADP-dependent oxidoreductase n=1 Tax=Hydrogenophaga sp. BPS33 TaxID=2651974 RepID=UPI001320123F|nr:NADP-dependent oxidoreductase [Hydrogenophaga sp. BPS33]QHE84584.1 NADP-dependent oxidoreductase [Hydrogenophaga sp. BPS33]
MNANLQVRIRHLPRDTVEAGHFELHEALVPLPAAGQVLVQQHFLSLDPYMRKRLADACAGRDPLAPGDVMMGRTVGRVVESRDPAFRAGDTVLGWGGWQRYAAEPAQSLQKVEPVEGGSLSVHLGALGRPGITAWLGVVSVAQLRAGECLVVSSAAGAVGSLAVQMARHIGARVVGIAGGRAKCDAVVGQLGAQACVDYKAPDFAQQLAHATPDGVDVVFENVGAGVLDATLNRMNENGRVAVCGLMGHYHSGDPYGFQNFARVLDRALKVTGFRIDANAPLHAQALGDLRAWFGAGVLRSWETVAQGLEQAPDAFVSMLQGRGQGKTLVQII